MQIFLTEQAKHELDRIDKRINRYPDLYDELEERELLLVDAKMYTEGAYVENEFDNLQEWCREVGSLEYNQTYLNTHPNAVREKVNKMLKENIIEIK